VITLQDWAEVRHLHLSEGLSVRAIAKRLGIARETVVRAVASGGPPTYQRVRGSSSFDVLESTIRGLLSQFPTMPASVLAQRVGWSGSPSWFRKKIALLRPEYAPADPADRISYVPGDQGQCDLWFPPVRVPLSDGQVGSPPVLVVVASFSRFITARMLPTRSTPDLLAGMWSLLSDQLGAVPRRLVWDNEAGIGRRNVLAQGVTGFSGSLATRIVQLKPFDPESKGIVERANKFLETSFLPGREFISPHDFNEQLAGWLPIANQRQVRSLRARPVDLITFDKAAMLSLPPMLPTNGFTSRVRLPRDYYVRVLGNDYSVSPSAIGRMVDVHADLDRVWITLDGQLAAEHARIWGSGSTITDPEHVIQAAKLRHLFQRPAPVVKEEDLLRDLTDYDTAFGVAFDQAWEIA
jgi:hypothetical protein